MRHGKPTYNEDDSLNFIHWHKEGTVLIHPTRGRMHNPSESDFLECGYLPEVIHDTLRFEQVDTTINICPLGATEITHPINNHDIAIVRAIIKATIEGVSDSKVNAIAPARKVQRAIAKGARLNRKALKHLQNPAQFPKLTPEEESIADALETLQDITELIREAEDAIIEELSEMDDSEVYALPDNWEENHSEWP